LSTAGADFLDATSPLVSGFEPVKCRIVITIATIAATPTAPPISMIVRDDTPRDPAGATYGAGATGAIAGSSALKAPESKNGSLSTALTTFEAPQALH